MFENEFGVELFKWIVCGVELMLVGEVFVEEV